MAIINFKEEDIKECKIALANQKLTPLQNAFLMQYIINLEEQLKASEKARKETMKLLKDFLCSEYYCSQGKELYDFCLNLNKKLDIDKGE